MCTLTFTAGPGGYELLFNRDELRSRAPAIPPRIGRAGRTRFVAPIDGDHGGTWILVNDRGLSIALLNLYPEEGGADRARETVEAARESRGRLLLELAAAASPGEVARELPLERARRFRPFRLLSFAPDAPPRMLVFDGDRIERRTLAPSDNPIVSSARDPAGVRCARSELYRRMGLEREARLEPRLAYHRSHLPQRGAHSVCMHRSDARTVSLTRVRVERSRAVVWYCPDAPCRGRFGTPVELPTRVERTGGPAPSDR